jgi:hypothetical protein
MEVGGETHARGKEGIAVVELPALLFEDVTGCQPPPLSANEGGPAAAAGGGDRRTAERVFLSRRALLAPIRGHKAVTPRAAMVRDLSLNGIGLLHDRKLKPGEEFVIYLPRRHGGKAIPVRCVTAHCESGGPRDGLYQIGASFVAVLDPEYAPPAGPGAAAPRPLDLSADDELEEAKRIQQAMFTD